MKSLTSTCPDCGVSVGEEHDFHCDVARCKGCGRQALQCVQHSRMPMTTWTGEWPGIAECREYGIAVYNFPGHRNQWTEDLNRLAALAFAGVMRWDVEQERYIKTGDINGL